MENDQLIGAQGCRGVGTSFVVTELDFEHVRGQQFYDRAYLAAVQPTLSQVFR